MREILFRGKRIDNGEWVEGFYVEDPFCVSYEICDVNSATYHREDVDPSTAGQYTGLQDKNGKRIFEGDVVRYNTFNDFDCHSVVKIGEYEQDGSGGEYSPIKCYGFYVDVDNFTCPDWAEDDPSCFSEYLAQQNLLEVAAECEVIGNIHDNPELLEGGAHE